jgi:hypothetical protein
MMQAKASIRKHMPLLAFLFLIDGCAFNVRLEAWVARTRNSAERFVVGEEVDDGIDYSAGRFDFMWRTMLLG